MQLLKSKTNIVIFADLDGTLLNESYSFKEVQPIINQLKAAGVKIVFCSSKTRSEIEYFKEILGIRDPFVSENGAAVFMPKGYFKQTQSYTRETEQHYIIELCVPYSIIRQAFERIKANCGCPMVGFGDMTAKEIEKDSGLSAILAKLAKKREYTEPFKLGKEHEEQIFNAIRQENLCCTKGGRYYHLTGHHSKATAIILLKKMYERELGDLRTVGVGDYTNDLGMLRVVDKPFMVEDKKIGLTWKTILKEILSIERNQSDC
jgi:mannosyl-3-phosphoglycerate phosphatase